MLSPPNLHNQFRVFGVFYTHVYWKPNTGTSVPAVILGILLLTVIGRGRAFLPTSASSL